MKKGTRDILIIGGVGLAGYLLIANRAAAAQPSPAPGVPIAPGTNLFADLINSLQNAFKPSPPTPAPAISPIEPGTNLFSDLMNAFTPATPAAPAPALAPVEGLGSLSGTVFRKAR